MNLNRKFFIGSFIFHLVIIALSFFMPKSGKINKTFLVYGAHSKAPMHAYFKPMRVVKNKYSSRVALNKKNNKTIKKKTKKDVPKAKPKAKAKAKLKPKIKKKIKAQTKKEKKSVKKIENKKVSIRQAKKKKVASRQAKKKTVTSKKIKKDKSFQENKKQKQKKLEEDILNFDLLGSDNPELLKYQRNIQREVCRVWRPPLGVKKGTESTVQFSVNRSGNVTEFEFIKKSDVLIYDLSITRVANKFQFARCLWGKKFSIVFRQ